MKHILLLNIYAVCIQTSNQTQVYLAGSDIQHEYIMCVSGYEEN